MSSKLRAAKIASWCGVRAVIAGSKGPQSLVDAVAGIAGVGTTVAAHDRKVSARKLWIGFAGEAEGSIVVDDGARKALLERNVSLLPAGVTGVSGEFLEGDLVAICDAEGIVIARGVVKVDAATARSNQGKRTDELAESSAGVVVHRDDLVLLVV